MSRPVTFTADTKNDDDGALSVSPSLGVSVGVGVESGSAPAAEEVIAVSRREDLPAVAPGGIVACETPTEGPCDNPSDWNGDAQLEAPLEKEVEEANDAAIPTSVPVPAVPKHQGLPSFAQSEFYTVDMILFYFEIHLALILILPLWALLLFSDAFVYLIRYRLFVANVVNAVATASK
jgi:hypothetical protein